MDSLSVFEVEYTSSGYHYGLVCTSVVAKDSDEAVDIASHDYYYGSYISVNWVRDATEMERDEYERDV